MPATPDLMFLSEIMRLTGLARGGYPSLAPVRSSAAYEPELMPAGLQWQQTARAFLDIELHVYKTC